MKKFIVLLPLILFTYLISFAQDVVQYSKVINFESADQSKLFDLCKEWVAINFKSANDVIQLADKETGSIICKGSFEYNYHNKPMYSCFSGHLSYTLKISVKENKIKVDFLDFTHSAINTVTCQLGLITDAPIYTDKGLNKKYQNDVWNDLKIAVSEYSEKFHLRMESEINKNLKSQNDW